MVARPRKLRLVWNPKANETSPYGFYELRTYGPKPITIAILESTIAPERHTVFTTYALWREEPYVWNWVTGEGREGWDRLRADLAREGFDPDWN